MIASLDLGRLREMVKACAREQAFVDGAGVRGVPMHGAGEVYAGNADLTVVFEAIDTAAALVWRPQELTVRVLGDGPRYFRVARPDGGPGDVVADPHLEQLMRITARVDSGIRVGTYLTPGRLGALAALLGTVWTVTCPSQDCRLVPQWPADERPEAEHLAGIHDRLRHRGTTTAEIVRICAVDRTCWEVDAPDGTPLYRGLNAELANDLYRQAPPGSHLLPAPATRDLILAGGGR